MSGKVLVDTSVWISYFRYPDREASAKLPDLLRSGDPAYTGIIAMELRRGAKTRKELDVLEELFNSIEYLPTKEENFTNAGDMGRLLLQKGISVGTVDLLIAQIAIANNVPLYTLDNHFTPIARHTTLQLY